MYGFALVCRQQFFCILVTSLPQLVNDFVRFSAPQNMINPNVQHIHARDRLSLLLVHFMIMSWASAMVAFGSVGFPHSLIHDLLLENTIKRARLLSPTMITSRITPFRGQLGKHKHWTTLAPDLDSPLRVFFPTLSIISDARVIIRLLTPCLFPFIQLSLWFLGRCFSQSTMGLYIWSVVQTPQGHASDVAGSAVGPLFFGALSQVF